jgi:hypothetical protein
VEVGKAVFCIRFYSAANFSQESADGSVAADLTGKSTLETNPLSVNVKIALKPGTVTLDTGSRANNDRCCWH